MLIMDGQECSQEETAAVPTGAIYQVLCLQTWEGTDLGPGVVSSANQL